MSTYWGHGGLYETWVDSLRRWAAGENPGLDTAPRLAQEDFPAETWNRFALHLGEALDTRLKAWADRLMEAVLAAPDEFSAGRELAQARAGLRTIRGVAGHPCLPEALRLKFCELVDSQIKDIQQQLERGLDDLAAANGSDPRWVEHRRRTLRDNALTATLRPSVSGAADDPWARTHAADRPRRRVITD
ncbi:hypothetical protein [Streptomyces albogriseolus]|uniref:hypothetical protein n=1 Tax=Streptomyces albogriseolus TaxID=1887 RepID=UPI0034614D3A